MDDLLSSLLGGTQDDADEKQQGGADLLGDLLGGLTGAQQGQQNQGGDLAGLLGGVLSQGGSSGLAGLMGSLLGGGNVMSNALVTSIAQSLAEKIGIPPATAQAVVGFALAKLLPVLLSRLQGQETPQASSGASEGVGLDLDDLLKRVGSRKPLGHAYLAASGMPDELAEQEEIDVDTAEQGLEQTFLMLGEQLLGDKGQQGLDGLLDSLS